MNSFKRLKTSVLRVINHTRQPIRPFIVSKVVPVATGAVVFGLGCMTGSSASKYRMLPEGNPRIFGPLSLTSGASDQGSRTAAVRNNPYETDPKPTAYGAKLMERTTQEMIEISPLIAEDRKKPSEEGHAECQRRLVRLKSLHDAVWALHMIDIARDPKVWKLLERHANELNLPGTDIMITMEKAAEATVSGDTRDLEAHIKEFIAENLRLGRCPPPATSQLEKAIEQLPAGSAILSKLRVLSKVAMQNTEESRLVVQETMYGLWWILERNAKDFDRVVGN